MEVGMKLKLYSLIILSAVTLLFGCKTAGKLYQKGNYDEAVELAATPIATIARLQVMDFEPPRRPCCCFSHDHPLSE